MGGSAFVKTTADKAGKRRLGSEATADNMAAAPCRPLPAGLRNKAMQCRVQNKYRVLGIAKHRVSARLGSAH